MKFITKSIELNFKEWHDKKNGNTYFSGTINIDNKETIEVPFQYGNGDSYLHESKAILHEHNYISCEYGESIKQFCQRNNINYIQTFKVGCKKNELK